MISTRRQEFAISFAEETLAHLAAIERKYHPLIREAIEQQMRYLPNSPTRNRKLLEQPAPFDATWEPRFGPNNHFRVFV